MFKSEKKETYTLVHTYQFWYIKDDYYDARTPTVTGHVSWTDVANSAMKAMRHVLLKQNLDAYLPAEVQAFKWEDLKNQESGGFFTKFDLQIIIHDLSKPAKSWTKLNLKSPQLVALLARVKEDIISEYFSENEGSEDE